MAAEREQILREFNRPLNELPEFASAGLNWFRATMASETF
jgi:hypothetical protein